MIYENKRLTSIMTASLVIFVSIAFLSLYNDGFLFDEVITSWIAQNSNAMVESMELITVIGSSEFILVATLGMTVFFLSKRDWFNSFFLIILTFGGILLNLLLKVSFQRKRPGEMSNIEVFNYTIEIASYSFPSGHTMRSVILFTFLIYISYRLVKKESIKILLYAICSIIIAGVALSRIVLGAHFLSDTIAAISISVAWFCFVYITCQSYIKKCKSAG
ncbi:phosphatase PAP2 family protein [Domibacillus epiphyticus]|uniref:Phosphatidic acid phosphatase type 2/haloperoxidase domain-containing protein n=1 Tax=Domibacillus epiphyticus TaxID=1714355 RepID=A0A1V2AA35_9BACI|nr:phosphatase PAP2 family protein [Domibacillus epiphyticus]OMP67858.1 hypothetical protein BTO28_05060 [Domibacillus epiphyticus]